MENKMQNVSIVKWANWKWNKEDNCFSLYCMCVVRLIYPWKSFFINTNQNEHNKRPASGSSFGNYTLYIILHETTIVRTACDLLQIALVSVDGDCYLDCFHSFDMWTLFIFLWSLDWNAHIFHTQKRKFILQNRKCENRPIGGITCGSFKRTNFFVYLFFDAKIENTKLHSYMRKWRRQ